MEAHCDRLCGMAAMRSRRYLYLILIIQGYFVCEFIFSRKSASALLAADDRLLTVRTD